MELETRIYESKDVHEALSHIANELVKTTDVVIQARKYGTLTVSPQEGELSPNIVKVLDALKNIEVAHRVLQAFVTASLNDDTNTWDHAIPPIENNS